MIDGLKYVLPHIEKVSPTKVKFSVLIPTLNEEKYIGHLLDSLKAQSFTDFEVIIVDAHSDDKTVSLIKNYQTSLNLHVVNSSQRNISYQRNLAAKKAAADHLIFFDADVVVDKNFLGNIDRALIDHHFSIASSWLNPLSDRLADRVIFGLFNHVYLETAKYFTPGGTGAFLYVHKDVLCRVGGFDLTTNFGEDFDLIKRVHRLGYKYHLFRRPSIKFSVRRLDKEGRLFYLYKMIRSGIYYHTHGTIHDPKVFIKNEFGKF